MMLNRRASRIYREDTTRDGIYSITLSKYKQNIVHKAREKATNESEHVEFSR